jgi:hypothetical protein
MHRSFRFSFPSLLALSGLLLTGCSSQRLATQAVSFNLTLERAQNEMLLLNIIRAKDRLPMYISGISGLTGNVQTTLTSSLGHTYTDAGAKKAAEAVSGAATAVTTTKEITDTLTRAYTPSIGATFSKNPTFTLAVLDTQEFIRGFLAPVGKDTLHYYWTTQDWPPELLFYLLVQRVEIQEEDGMPRVLRNYPDSSDSKVREMEEFAQWAQEDFLAKDPQIVSVPIPESIGPALLASEVTNLEGLIAVAKEGLSITKIDPATNATVSEEREEARYQLQKLKMDLRFRLGSSADEGSSAKEESEESATKREYNRNIAQEKERMAVTQAGEKTVTFVLRSPEALIYYLGQLARLENRDDNPLTPYVCIQGQYQPLFVARPAGICGETLVDADTGRARYSIPPTALANKSDGCGEDENGKLSLRPTSTQATQCEGGRSMQAMRLLNQIISLQKSAKDNPGTALVRLIN